MLGSSQYTLVLLFYYSICSVIQPKVFIKKLYRTVKYRYKYLFFLVSYLNGFIQRLEPFSPLFFYKLNSVFAFLCQFNDSCPLIIRFDCFIHWLVLDTCESLSRGLSLGIGLSNIQPSSICICCHELG